MPSVRATAEAILEWISSSNYENSLVGQKHRINVVEDADALDRSCQSDKGTSLIKTGLVRELEGGIREQERPKLNSRDTLKRNLN